MARNMTPEKENGKLLVRSLFDEIGSHCGLVTQSSSCMTNPKSVVTVLAIYQLGVDKGKIDRPSEVVKLINSL